MTAAASPDPAPPPSDRLRTLAQRLERLGRGARGDPETLLVERLTIAAALMTLARELEAERR